MNDLYKTICERIKADKDAKREERELMLDDQRFAAGDQWPMQIKRKREIEGRPIQTINRIPAFIDQIVGDARQNKPSIKVHAGEDGDIDIALIYDGLLRAIQNQSNADFAYDSAIENTATFGFGAWRIKTDYENELSFNQVIKIDRIADPLNVYFDKNAEQPDYSDANHVTILVKMTKDEFKARWPKAEVSNFDYYGKEWLADDCVIVAEHWYKTNEPKTLYLLQNPEDGSTKTSFEKEPFYIVVGERKTTDVKVKCAFLSGADEPLEIQDWAGKYLPIVGVNGKEDLVDGKRTLRGLVRFAKDPQRMYNYWRTIDTEQKALAPKAPVLVTAKQIQGLEDIWQDALSGNLPYLIVNDDPSAPQPQRLNAGIMDKGASEAALMCVDEIKSTTGIYSASLGDRDNETSGRAILAQQRKSDIGNFTFIDNVARAIKYTGLVILDLIPKIYDSARVVQIMGADGEQKLQRINQLAETKGGQKFVDLSVGQYDLTVSQGASYATKRIEALNSLIEIARVNPAIMQIAGDLIVKNMDWDGSEEIAERLKKTLPPNLQDNEQSDIPTEVQGIIEQGKQQIEQLQQQVNELLNEKDDKEDELRLKKYEIDVKAELELAKLATGAGLQPNDVIAIVNQMLANAAQQPELPEEGETYQHEQQEVYNPMIEQNEQEIEQMPVDENIDLSQLNLPDVVQQNEAQ